MKIPYWKHGYGKLICSECGYIIDERDSMKRYLDYRKNQNCCPQCGADMREPLKRCYYKERYQKDYCSCGDCITKAGTAYCIRQTKERREELKSWGAYYRCECFEPVENEQITLW